MAPALMIFDNGRTAAEQTCNARETRILHPDREPCADLRQLSGETIHVSGSRTVDFVEIAVLLPTHSQRLRHFAMNFQAHSLKLFRRLGDQTQGQLPGLDTLLLGFIFKCPLNLLLLLGLAQLGDLRQQLWIGLSEALQRNSLPGLFRDHLSTRSPTHRHFVNRLKSISFCLKLTSHLAYRGNTNNQQTAHDNEGFFLRAVSNKICKPVHRTANLATRKRYNLASFTSARRKGIKPQHCKDVTVLKKIFLISAWAFPCSLVSATPLQASFDPDAQYSIVSITGSLEDRSVITQRIGLSGTSYSARQFNCVTGKVRLMGSGTSLQDLANAQADDDATPIFKGSLSRTISEVACNDDAAPDQGKTLQKQATLTLQDSSQ